MYEMPLNDPTEKIPERAREAFSILVNELISLQEQWITFQVLFSHSEERVALLNRSASNFFVLVHDLLFQSILVRLSRLEEKANGQKNLSLEFLIVAADIDRASDLGKKLLLGLTDFREKVAHLKRIRNKKIAHLDHDTATGHGSTLEPVTTTHLKDALASGERFLNEFYAHFADGTVAFDGLVVYEGAEELCVRLAQADAYSAMVREGRVASEEQLKYLR